MTTEIKTKLTLNNARIAFPVLGTPKAAAADNPKLQYSAAFLIPKDHPQVGEINAIIDHVLEAKWPGKGASIRKAAAAIGKICLKDGDTKDDYEGYAGHWFINARLDAEKGKPRLYGLGGLKAGEVAPSVVYAGAKVRAVLSFFAYGGQNNIPKGVGCGLGDVQFIGDAPQFSAAAPRATEDAFGAIDDPDSDPLASAA